MDKRFWRNKRVFVTGASGFVGSHLANTLLLLGANMIIENQKNRRINVTRRDILESVFQKKPSIIFHLAGEALVEKGQEAPFETFQTNIMGTLNILELSRIYQIPRVIIASTSHVYGGGQPPFIEDDPPRPSRPYETSKTATDLLAQSYADSFNLPVVIPRFVNIFGGGDKNFSRLIPKILLYLIQKKPMPIWGGAAKREYLYIDDAVDAYLKLAMISDAKLEKNRIFNFGTGDPVAVRDLISTIRKLSGISLQTLHDLDGREGEIMDQHVSSEKARRILGWKPKIHLKIGLVRTIVWYKEYFRNTHI